MSVCRFTIQESRNLIENVSDITNNVTNDITNNVTNELINNVSNNINKIPKLLLLGIFTRLLFEFYI